MLGELLAALAWVSQFSDPLAWLVVASFAAGALVELRDRELARPITVAAWVLFAAFWLSLVHHFAFEAKSIIEGIGSAAAVPLSLYVGYLLWKGRDSLFVLTRAVALMGLVFMPFETITPLKRVLIETVTRQTEFLMTLLGVDPTVVSGAEYGHAPFRSTFYFTAADDPNHSLTYTILIACTGIGSMAIFVGLIGAVRAPLRNKLRALAVSIPIIYALNLVRNIFIGIGFGKQKFHIAPDLVMSAFALSDPYRVSYIIADRIISQSLAVVALVFITWFVVRELPEVLVVIEDLIFLVTGDEYDLRAAFNLDQPVRADGDGR
ncbi:MULTISPECIES: archaeosortase A [unclassified Haladaptatus]|uniref:archaeosortase A n=1 Tax=unclassified Haladaptatus TaxID=2622732 RepID=UPI0023E89ADB|nr:MULTISPECIES: archaeosortase A [unclassified Haladaptatus]